MAPRPADFLAAVQFLTRIPVRLERRPDTAAALPWFPIIGALVGAASGGVYVGLGKLIAPAPAAALAVLAAIAITGAFHEDGLADSADGLGGWNVEERRRILKDSRHGSYAVAAMCGSILVRTLTLASITGPAGFAAAVVAHTSGRSAALAAMIATRHTDHVDGHGLGAAYLAGLRPAPVVAGIASGIAVIALAVGWWAAVVVAVVATAVIAAVVLLRRAFSTLGGDAFGAVEQVGEIVALVAIAALATRHSLWWSD